MESGLSKFILLNNDHFRRQPQPPGPAQHMFSAAANEWVSGLSIIDCVSWSDLPRRILAAGLIPWHAQRASSRLAATAHIPEQVLSQFAEHLDALLEHAVRSGKADAKVCIAGAKYVAGNDQ